MPKGDIYEDWYFILDSGVLDRLIEVVEGGARTIHDEVASFLQKVKEPFSPSRAVNMRFYLET